MSGLGDAHTHLTWNGSALGRSQSLTSLQEVYFNTTTTDNLGEIGVEEHTITTARSAMTYLDSGYTM